MIGFKKRKCLNFVCQKKHKLRNSLDITEDLSRIVEKISIYKNKIEIHEKRKCFSKINHSFKLYKTQFYRTLTGEMAREVNGPVLDIKEFWSKIWIKS